MRNVLAGHSLDTPDLESRNERRGQSVSLDARVEEYFPPAHRPRMPRLIAFHAGV